jgi:hypothetical protein
MALHFMKVSEICAVLQKMRPLTQSQMTQSLG